MMPAIARLLDRIREERVDAVRAELNAELICYRARTGDVDGSASQLRELRNQFGQGNVPRVSVWLMIADGVVSYYRNISETAQDRFARANAISRAASFDDLARLSSIWLAVMDFNRNDYRSMVQHVVAAKPSLARGDAADCRAFVALGDVAISGGAFADAVKWHESARQIAVKIGDEATIGAIIFNKALLNCLRAQTNIALGAREDAPLQFLGLQTDSSDFFHRAARNTSLPQLTHVLNARRSLVLGNYADAAPLFGEAIDRDLTTSVDSDIELLRAELALCLLRAGQTEEAQRLALELLSQNPPTLTPESEVIYWYCLDEVTRQASDAALHARVAEPFRLAQQRCLDERKLLEDVLEEVRQALAALPDTGAAA